MYPWPLLENLALRETVEGSKPPKGPRKPEFLSLLLLHETLGLDVLGGKGSVNIYVGPFRVMNHCQRWKPLGSSDSSPGTRFPLSLQGDGKDSHQFCMNCGEEKCPQTMTWESGGVSRGGWLPANTVIGDASFPGCMCVCTCA